MWIHEALIEVRGYPFPLDMLRYDGCYPSRQEDVTAIYESVGAYRRDQPVSFLAVRVTRWSDAKGSGFTVGRWESFGCKVTEIRARKA